MYKISSSFIFRGFLLFWCLVGRGMEHSREILSPNLEERAGQDVNGVWKQQKTLWLTIFKEAALLGEIDVLCYLFTQLGGMTEDATSQGIDIAFLIGVLEACKSIGTPESLASKDYIESVLDDRVFPLQAHQEGVVTEVMSQAERTKKLKLLCRNREGETFLQSVQKLCEEEELDMNVKLVEASIKGDEFVVLNLLNNYLFFRDTPIFSYQELAPVLMQLVAHNCYTILPRVVHELERQLPSLDYSVFAGVLFQAAKQGNDEALRIFLQLSSVHEKTELIRAALIEAILGGHVAPVARLLDVLEKASDPHFMLVIEYALLQATRVGNHEVVEMVLPFLSHHLKNNILLAKDVLDEAARRGDRVIIELLLRNQIYDDGTLLASALQEAAVSGKNVAVAILLEQKGITHALILKVLSYMVHVQFLDVTHEQILSRLIASPIFEARELSSELLRIMLCNKYQSLVKMLLSKVYDSGGSVSDVIKDTMAKIRHKSDLDDKEKADIIAFLEAQAMI